MSEKLKTVRLLKAIGKVHTHTHMLSLGAVSAQNQPILKMQLPIANLKKYALILTLSFFLSLAPSLIISPPFHTQSQFSHLHAQ